MSGGHFDCDYDYFKLDEWAKTVRNDGNPLFADLLHDVGFLLHEYDWWKSGDTSREDWLKAWSGFQNKWMKSSIRELSVKTVEELVRYMVYESIGLPSDESYEGLDKKFRGW